MLTLHSALKAFVFLIRPDSQNVKIVLFYVFIYIFINLYFIDVTYSLKHKDFLFKRIHYARLRFILENKVIILYSY